MLKCELSFFEKERSMNDEGKMTPNPEIYLTTATLRDQFAMAALRQLEKAGYQLGLESYAYMIADAMLEARDGQG
jgi:hypothetical protein